MSSGKIRIAYVNYWNDAVNDRYFSRFIEYHFVGFEAVEVSPFENPDIIVCSVFGDLNLISRLSAKIKIFYTGENLKRKEYRDFQNMKVMRNIFDLIIGFFETDIELKILSFPLWLQYYPFYSTKEDDTIITHIERDHAKNCRSRKDRFCTLIASHDRSGIRTKLTRSVAKVGKISFGGAFHLSQFEKEHNHVPFGSRAKVEYIKTSKFNICPENSNTPGYCTEKLFEALQAGCVPVYSGHSIPKVLNKNKIIFYDQNGPEQTFLECFQPVHRYEGNVFVEDAEGIISKCYEDLKNQLAHLLRTKSSLQITIFEPTKSKPEVLGEEEVRSNEAEASVQASVEASVQAQPPADTLSNEVDFIARDFSLLEQNAVISLDEQSGGVGRISVVTNETDEEEDRSKRDEEKDAKSDRSDEVAEFIQQLLETMETSTKERIKAKAKRNLQKI